MTKNEEIIKPISYGGISHYLYVFYSHDDIKDIYPMINEFQNRKLNIKYDDSIECGKDWLKRVKYDIEPKNGCAGILVFISDNLVNSEGLIMEIKTLTEIVRSKEWTKIPEIIPFHIDGKKIEEYLVGDEKTVKELKECFYTLYDIIGDISITEKDNTIERTKFISTLSPHKYVELERIAMKLSVYSEIKTKVPAPTKGYKYLGEYPQEYASDVAVSNFIICDSAHKTGNKYQYYDEKENTTEYYQGIIAKPFVFSTDNRNGYLFNNPHDEVVLGKHVFFKYSAIKWRVINETEDFYFLLSENIIDAIPYYSSSTAKTKINSEKAVSTNDYETSDVNAWLNTYFYNNAFSEKEKEMILDSKIIVNDEEDDINAKLMNVKLFILSINEIRGKNDFENTFDKDPKKMALTSDYARARGAFMSRSEEYYGNGIWWLRSRGIEVFKYRVSNDSAVRVMVDGTVKKDEGNVLYGFVGVRPAMRVDKKKYDEIYGKKSENE